ncbi:hypothetical protein pipiens_012526 [Culex pipiens pipiens]|uniref:receptor protein-tyrosine kinase n=1 Tax=Culex pipiens pipiens TaxID=38569 RepID=A0ABD1D395_CULPP
MVLRDKKNPKNVFKYRFPYDSKWELPREKVVLGKMLTTGVFGKVFLATASGLVGEGIAEVAVRMLNAEHSDEDVEDLVHELEVMKMVGRHPNIVNLLGCCSKDGPLYVIVDYSAHGNLQSFLRKHRFESDFDQDDKLVIAQNQLLSYVAQIASGMEYLASIDCIHRDLRARNVLVCEGYTMKITDYGRDVYNLDRFPKTSSGKVPIQWMAPESLLEYTFDEKSDVWAFGVTFWEVMTLGGVPYPELAECGQLMEFLKQGKRLEQPRNCPDGAYSIMSDCWQIKAVCRPNFG